MDSRSTFQADGSWSAFGQISALTAGETAPEDTDETQPAWPLNDDESVGSRQSQVERSSGVTAVADPRIARVSVGHTGSKIIAVGLRPAGTPKENIKVYNRQTKLAPELAGYGRLAATGAADDNEAPQITLRLRLLRGIFMPEDIVTQLAGCSPRRVVGMTKKAH